MSYIIEAFKALDCLNEETFAISDDGINKLAQFEQSDDLSDDITVYDMDAETEDDLEDSYVGKVILDCCVCHSKIYKDKSEVSIDEEQGIANIDMECPYCYSQEGFKVIGEVAPMTAEESTSETSAETDTDSIQESLKEAINRTVEGTLYKVCIEGKDEFLLTEHFEGIQNYLETVANTTPDFESVVYTLSNFTFNTTPYLEYNGSIYQNLIFPDIDSKSVIYKDGVCKTILSAEEFKTPSKSNIENYIIRLTNNIRSIRDGVIISPANEQFKSAVKVDKLLHLFDTEQKALDYVEESPRWRKIVSLNESKSINEDVGVNYEIEKLNESSWAEITRAWTEATENKLNVIRDAGLFNKLHDEVNNLEGITGFYTDCYSTVSPAYSDITEAQLKDSRTKMFALIREYYRKAQESNDDAYNWIEDNKEPKEHSKYKVAEESLKDSVDKILDKAIDKYFDGEVRDYKVNGDKVDVTFKDGSQKTFNKSIFDESLNEASTDRVQKLLSIIDNSFEVLEDAPINEDALEEAKQIRLSSIPGVTRDPSNDFADDGNRFQAYLYKGTVPITYLRDKEDVYITIAFHHLEDINYDEYKEFPSYKNADEFNGVPVDTFNAEIFQKNLEDAYKDIVDFLGSVEDVDSAQLEDRITSINNACKEYEEKVKQYIQDNALKIMKLSDYQFRELKNYVSKAGSRTADYIRNASSSSQRHFMSRDLESLKRQISNSWNFEYIEDILNSVQESITESPALSKVTGTLGAALDAHKEELANATTSEALVELLNKIRPEVKEGQQAYLDSVIERVKRLPAIKGMQFVYNLILKGDGMSTKLDAAKARKKATNESLEEVEVKTGDTKVEVSSDEDGKITVSSEPCETKETSEDNAEVIKPISDETRDSIENGETDVDIEDMDTDAFDELGESYLKRVYENVSAYKTSKVSTQDNKFVVEGLITFDSGNQKSTSFVFESANCTKDGRLKFIGENMQIAKGEKAFSLIGTADNKKFVTESFNYNYRAKNNIGKSTRLYGTIKRG